MNTYLMNIDKKYLINIKQGLKLHEYRLADERRRQIKIGDQIFFTCKEDLNLTLKVTVTDIAIYPSWQDCFDNTSNYLQDFQNIFASKEEIISQCAKFYTPSDVEKYGIIVFSIKI